MERQKREVLLSNEKVRSELDRLESLVNSEKLSHKEAGAEAKTLLLMYLTHSRIESMPPLRLKAKGVEVEKPIYGIPLKLRQTDRCVVFWALGIYTFPFEDGKEPTLQYTPSEFEGTLPIPDYYDLPLEEYLEEAKLVMDLLEGRAEATVQKTSQILIEKLIVANDQGPT